MDSKGYIINSISLNHTKVSITSILGKNILCVSSNRGLYLYHTSNLMLLTDTNDRKIEKMVNFKLMS